MDDWHSHEERENSTDSQPWSHRWMMWEITGGGANLVHGVRIQWLCGSEGLWDFVVGKASHQADIVSRAQVGQAEYKHISEALP